MSKQPRFQIIRSNGTKVVVTHDEEDLMFRAIEKLTGLDRAIAEQILLGGDPITHPMGTFRKLPNQAAAGADTKETPKPENPS